MCDHPVKLLFIGATFVKSKPILEVQVNFFFFSKYNGDCSWKFLSGFADWHVKYIYYVYSR